MWSINSIDQSGHRFIPFRARGPRTGRLYFLCFYFLGLGVVCVDPQDISKHLKMLILMLNGYIFKKFRRLPAGVLGRGVSKLCLGAYPSPLHWPSSKCARRLDTRHFFSIFCVTFLRSHE